MPERAAAKFIQPPNTLQRMFQGRTIEINSASLAAAEAAVEAMAVSLNETLLSDIKDMQSAIDTYRKGGEVTLSSLYRMSFDLKGLGGSLDFPLLTNLGDTLCQMFDQPRPLTQSDFVIIEAHISAMIAIVSQNVRGRDDPVGQAILAELASLVDDANGTAAKQR